jgi:hypothetical protein
MIKNKVKRSTFEPERERIREDGKTAYEEGLLNMARTRYY